MLPSTVRSLELIVAGNLVLYGNAILIVSPAVRAPGEPTVNFIEYPAAAFCVAGLTVTEPTDKDWLVDNVSVPLASVLSDKVRTDTLDDPEVGPFCRPALVPNTTRRSCAIIYGYTYGHGNFHNTTNRRIICTGYRYRLAGDGINFDCAGRNRCRYDCLTESYCDGT